MRNLPAWASLSIITVAVLLSPVLAFLMAIAVEILIGLLVEADAPVLPVLIATGATLMALVSQAAPPPRPAATGYPRCASVSSLVNSKNGAVAARVPNDRRPVTRTASAARRVVGGKPLPLGVSAQG